MYWLAMLISAGVVLPDSIVVHDYLTINGQKISKSLRNFVGSAFQINNYGVDAFRYYLLRGMLAFDDGDYSDESLTTLHTGGHWFNSSIANKRKSTNGVLQ